MDPAPGYHQFCGLARALDHVGDRWTLLVVRELLLGPRSYAALRSALPGMSPGLLSARLKRLEADGLVARNAAPRRSKAVEYTLTDAGVGLEPVVLGFIRWAVPWMAAGPGGDHVEPAWVLLGLKALLDSTPIAARLAGRVLVDVGGGAALIELGGGQRRVRPAQTGTPVEAEAVVAGDSVVVLGTAAGLFPLAESGLAVSGRRRLAEAALTPA